MRASVSMLAQKPHGGFIGGERAYSQGWGDWVQNLACWTHFITPTLKLPVSPASFTATITEWLRSEARYRGVHIPYAYGADLRENATQHGHLLVAGPSTQFGSIAVRNLRASFPKLVGLVDVKHYDADGSAAHYAMLARHPVRDVGVACPRRGCRRRGGSCRYRLGQG